ncbi:YtxH domain-containing protein [Caldalkalibacillus salinus]|uniref:YtxH domain-containing protein n=1 Tax=Caldalkalibacillus salinus TaxID=2803787 RepID=UPI0019229FCB|nr:YtxH domain-containing protein [Caldalkalibacillus salinus]
MAENNNNNNNMNGKDFVIGALVGGIIGAGAALLLTPKSGRDLRVDISDGYQTASQKTKEIAKNVGEKSEYFTGRVKEVAGHVKEDFDKFKTNLQDSEEEVTEETVAEESQEQVAASIDDESTTLSSYSSLSDTQEDVQEDQQESDHLHSAAKEKSLSDFRFSGNRFSNDV